MSRRVRTVVLASAAGAALCAALCAVLARKPIVEAWYLWQLESEHEALWRPALDYLSRAGSVRAIPRVLEIIKSRVERDEIIFSEHLSVICIMEANRAAALPVLIRELDGDDDAIKGFAAMYLGLVGRDAAAALPKLIALQGSAVPWIRERAASALKEIRKPRGAEGVGGLYVRYDLWPGIDMSQWRNVSHIKERAAVDDDVRTRRAIFWIDPADGVAPRPVDLDLPRCAILRDERLVGEDAVIVVQAESDGETVWIGYRDVSGGCGICTIGEVELLDEPDERFSQ